MEIIRKYTAIILHTKNINDTINIDLSYGDVTGPYYDLVNPKQEFESESEAIDYAFKTEPYGRWLILPLIQFNK